MEWIQTQNMNYLFFCDFSERRNWSAGGSSRIIRSERNETLKHDSMLSLIFRIRFYFFEIQFIYVMIFKYEMK